MTMQLSSTPHASGTSGTTGAASVSGATGAGSTGGAVLRCFPGPPPQARSPRWARLFSRAAAAFLTLATGCGEPASPDTSPPSSAASYFVELPAELGHGDQAIGSLRTALRRHGLELKNEYSELVGLAGTVSVRGSAAAVQALLQEVPGLQAHAVVWRYPDGSCGDGSCGGDEAPTPDRGAICSLDCGAQPEHSARDELSNSWHVGAVAADQLWPLTRGEGIHVAVLDTGYDSGPGTQHPDRPTELGFGYNLATGSPDYSAVNEHGTHVAGVIAAPRNGVGAVGVAPGATVHVMQVFQNNAGHVGATDADIIAAIELSIRNGYHILNLSLGGPRDSEPEHRAVRKAYDAGLLVVVAAGNAEDSTKGALGTAAREFPGAYPESLSVGAVSRGESIASFSSTGPSVTLSAPGVGIYSTVPRASGEREVTAVFTLARLGERTMSAALPVGSSGTGLDGSQVVACGFGTPAEVAACAPLGKVALMQRGPGGPGETALPFSEKIRNARLQGAIGVLLYNHRYGEAATAGAVLDSISLGTGQPVPVVGLAAGDGEYLVDQLQKGQKLTVRIAIRASDYATFDGTSDATPIVSGVAALLWSRFPTLTNVELRQLLVESAVDLGAPGRDDAFGWGRIDALRALRQAAPRARCGDGRLDPGSEVCDSARPSPTSCDELGYDSVAGGAVTCGRSCTSLDGRTCQCLPGRGPFQLSLAVTENVNLAGVIGTLAVYHVELGGKPVRGAVARVATSHLGRDLGVYQTDPSNVAGDIYDFNRTQGTGATPGDYTLSPVLTKAGGRCHDDQPMSPASYILRVKS